MPILDPVRPAFRALAKAIVPEAEHLDARGWGELESIVEDALAARPRSMRRQLVLFIRALSVLPVFRWGRGFRRLDPHLQSRFLASMQNSPVFLLRRGFWGLRTLVYMGYYGALDGYRAVGYDARLRGWLEHPAATRSAREATEAGMASGSGGTSTGPSSAESPSAGPEAGSPPGSKGGES